MSLLPYASYTHRRKGFRGPVAPYVVLLQSQTASGDSSISFTSNIDATYGEYIFRFYNCNPATDGQNFKWQVDDDAGNNGYNDFLTLVSSISGYTLSTSF